MKKIISMILALAMVLALAGCAGTTVVVNNYNYYGTDATESTTATTPVETEATEPVVAEGAVRTGLAIVTGLSAADASAEEEGNAEFAITLAAIMVDENDVILDCEIDAIGHKFTFDATGAITSDITAEVLTKNEKGDSYGMVAWGGAIAEWYAQVDAFEAYCIGKTIEELKAGAVGETGYAQDADLATSATIYLGGYVSAVEVAVNNAQHLGAQAGDELKLAVISSVDGSTSADAENAGLAQLYTNVAAITLKDGVITSAMIDAVQAKVNFDATGTITTDLTAPIQTKNELGEGYGMKAWGGAIAEWNEQAASFCAYITGKTPAEVSGIAVDESTKPTDADLLTSVTIKIGGLQSLIAKTCG